MNTVASTPELTLASAVAAEDLAVGDFVALLSEVYEFPSFFWCDGPQLTPNEPVRIRFQSRSGGVPLKIQAICLPFVFVKTPRGEFETLDIRRQQLVRLDRSYAATVYKHSKK